MHVYATSGVPGAMAVVCTSAHSSSVSAAPAEPTGRGPLCWLGLMRWRSAVMMSAAAAADGTADTTCAAEAAVDGRLDAALAGTGMPGEAGLPRLLGRGAGARRGSSLTRNQSAGGLAGGATLPSSTTCDIQKSRCLPVACGLMIATGV